MLVLLLVAALGGGGWLVARAGGRGLRASGPAARPQPNPSPSVQVQRPVLRGLSGPYAGAAIPLDQGPVAIGRDPALARLVLPAHCTAISQRHALVTYRTGLEGFVLEDCWSTNGVFLMTTEGDGQRLPPGQSYPLVPGARFYLGTPEIAFQVDLETKS
nr:FHA domain-containing protein [Allochromatium palmeri]